MKKIFFIIFSVVLSMGLFAKDYTSELKRITSNTKNYHSGDYWFTFDSEGTGAQILAYTGSAKKVEIPSEIEELPVTQISSWYSDKAEEIRIPSKVYIIMEHAFEECNLSKVTYEEGSQLSIVEGYAFAKNNLTEINLPDKFMIISEKAFCGNPIKTLFIRKNWYFYTNYYNGKSELTELETVEYEDGCKRVENEIFADCKKLKKVILPNSIVMIGSSAFNNCISLTDFNFPKSLKYIGPSTFAGCIALSSITIPDDIVLDYTEDYASYFDEVTDYRWHFDLVSYSQFKGCPIDFKTAKKLRALGFKEDAF